MVEGDTRTFGLKRKDFDYTMISFFFSETHSFPPMFVGNEGNS